MKRYLFLMIGLFILMDARSQSIINQTSRTATATISGKIEGYSKDTLYIYFFKHKIGGYWNIGSTFTEYVVGDNGDFHYTTPAISQPSYFVVTAKAKRNPFSAADSGHKLNYEFLVEPGDNVQINITQNGFTCSGKGAEKYKCMMDVDTAKTGWEKRFYSHRNITTAESIKKDVDVLLNVLAKDDKEKYMLAVLDNYKGIVNDTILQIKKCDILSFSLFYNYQFFADYWRSSFKLPDSTIRRAKMKSFFDKKIDLPMADISDYAKSMSAWYPEFALRSINGRLLTRNNIATVIDEHKVIKMIEEYPSQISDVIYAEYLANKSRTPGILNYQEGYYNSVINKIKDSTLKNMMVELNDLTAKGKPAYQFELPGLNGKQVDMSDFKGKVVVMDFWYTGCLACAISWKDFQLVEDHYKNNDQVVFISVCVDPDKETWVKSVRSGTYTSPNSAINVLASGKKHPLPRYYNIQAYPKFLIIDKDSKIYDYNAPRPDAIDGVNQMINRIETAASK